jgi:3,4-dihydroxy-9,10-secoandrosta-1,3,5(10)-triene-9,17-dione 4,5-dioxygenase
MRIRGLAYVVVEAVSPQAWGAFGEDVVGLAAVADGRGGLVLKADERLGRIFVEPGDQDRYAASGWELADETAFEAALERLCDAGVAFERGTTEQANTRGALGLARFRDPAGNRHELAWGYRSDFSRFVSPVGVPRFVIGELGLGHTVLPAPDFEATARFFGDVMSFGLADLMVHRPLGEAGPAQRIHFMHCGNPRHHSLALLEGEVASGCVHIMLEYDSLDEVGRALDRAQAHGAQLTASLGRHVNDGVTSFYCRTPGGFSIELGYGGRLMDWDRHTVFESTSVSLWGHDFSLGFNTAEQGAEA